MSRRGARADGHIEVRHAQRGLPGGLGASAASRGGDESADLGGKGWREVVMLYPYSFGDEQGRAGRACEKGACLSFGESAESSCVISGRQDCPHR